MAHRIEANPLVLSPEYWDGIDVWNPNHFIGKIDSPEPHIGLLRGGIALGALQRVLTGASDGNSYLEVPTRVSYEPEPMVRDVPVGSVVVLEKEMIIRYMQKGRVTEESEPSLDKPTAQIEAPFMRYWLRSSQQGIFSPGIEKAVFPEHGIEYVRRLTWGVVMKQMGGNTFIRGVPFDRPRVGADGKVHVPSRRDRGIIVQRIPFEMSAAQPTHISGLDPSGRDISCYVADRILRAHVIQDNTNPKNDRDRTKGKRAGQETLQKIRDKMEDIIKNPIPNPSP